MDNNEASCHIGRESAEENVAYNTDMNGKPHEECEGDDLNESNDAEEHLPDSKDNGGNKLMP